MTTYTTGASLIPELPLRYKMGSDKDWQTYLIPKQAIEVKSLLVASGSGALLRDIKPPLDIPARMNFVFIVLILCALLSLFVYKYLTHKKPLQQAATIRAAHEIAYEQLRALQEKDLVGQGKVKEYFIEISDIIRHYLENRFSLRAPEMTTEEFLLYVRDWAQLINTHKDLLRGFLVSCDLVKFARYDPSAEEIHSVFRTAKNFIDQTKEEAASAIA